MERNIGDPLNKAFEAYRQASIEKATVKKELQQKTEYFERYTKMLQQQIEEQRQHILKLEAQLSLGTRVTPGEKCTTALRKQEVETLSSCDHHPDNTSSSSQGNKQFLDYADALQLSPHEFLTASEAENGEVLEIFQKLQGMFQVIQKLTRRQNDHLKKLCCGNDTANEPQFSMPIQCTDGTAEQAEGPFSSTVGSEVLQDELPGSMLASRGACQEEEDIGDIKLSVRYPPPTDSEYEFLNSAPEKPMEPVGAWKGLAASASMSEDAPLKFPYPVTPLNPAPPSSSLSLESVRGPQQPLWSPKLCEAADEAPAADPQQHQSTGNCAFCNSAVPQAHLYSHLNSHFQNNGSNGH